jgi:Bacterial regulatory proteins, luxR family
VSEPIAHEFRRALLVTAFAAIDSPAYGPGVIVFDGKVIPSRSRPARTIGSARWSKFAAYHPSRIQDHPGGCRKRACTLDPSQDPLQIGARSRVPTRSGSWLLLYGTRLAGGADAPTAAIIQPATPAAVAPLVTLAYGLSERESQVTQLCMEGPSTRQMANALALPPHSVRDHLKSIFGKTGVWGVNPGPTSSGLSVDECDPVNVNESLWWTREGATGVLQDRTAASGLEARVMVVPVLLAGRRGVSSKRPPLGCG